MIRTCLDDMMMVMMIMTMMMMTTLVLNGRERCDCFSSLSFFFFFFFASKQRYRRRYLRQTYDVILRLKILFHVGFGGRSCQAAYPVELGCKDAWTYARVNSYRYQGAAIVHSMIRDVDYSDEPFMSHVWHAGNASQLEARTLLY